MDVNMKKYSNKRTNDEVCTATTIPFEFKMACTIYNMSPKDVLQCFIDHVSFYDSLSQRFNGPYSYATNVLISYPYEENEKISKAFSRNRDHAIKCIRGLLNLIMDPNLTEEQRRKKSLPIISELHKITPNNYIKTNELKLDKNTTLRLTLDFRLFCEIHELVPAKYLEHFMANISLSDISARNSLGMTELNYAVAFFSALSDGYKNINEGNLPHPDLHFNFIDRMQEMHLRALFIRNLDQKKQMYQEVYYSHYLKLIKRSENYYGNSVNN